MHELSIAEALLDQVRSHVPPGDRLTSVSVEAGAAQAIDPSSLTFAWQALVANTPLQNAKLQITVLPWSLQCNTCRRSWSSPDPFERCLCGSEDIAPKGSSDLRLLSIDVDVDESFAPPQELEIQR